DLLAYMRLLHNPRDSVSFNRILNVPPRGIGKRTHQDLITVADRLGVSPVTALKLLKEDEVKKAGDSAPQGESGSGEGAAPNGKDLRDFPYARYFDTRARRTLIAFYDLLVELNRLKDELSLTEFFDALVEKIGYADYVRDGTKEGDDRWNN